ncbi:MAG TPA: hypothetical protein VMJ93_07750 [Verrucomicrobiae bacterium]|nr:hypothetical protein [Verrucomicrobiae bacterium]
MPEVPRYAILGRGRWSGVVQKALESEGRAVEILGGARRRPGESDSVYSSRLAESLAAPRASIAWICVPPGPHVSLMILAALRVGLDVIAESPWLCPPDVTRDLRKISAENNRLVGVHFEYCLLDEVESWRGDFGAGRGFTFGGRFVLGRANKQGIPPLADLGCHLAAIREYAVPESSLGPLHCGYDARDERAVWLEKNGARFASIDFTANRQPIIQRYARKFEDSLRTCDFPFSLDFAEKISRQVSALGAS